MKNIIKKGACIALIYLVAIGCTMILAGRIERLEEATAETSSLSIN